MLASARHALQRANVNTPMDSTVARQLPMVGIIMVTPVPQPNFLSPHLQESWVVMEIDWSCVRHIPHRIN